MDPLECSPPTPNKPAYNPDLVLSSFRFGCKIWRRKSLFGKFWQTFNPILTGSSTSIFWLGASKALHHFSKMATTNRQESIYYWYINHSSSFEPFSSRLLRFFKKSVIKIQKNRRFLIFFKKIKYRVWYIKITGSMSWLRLRTVFCLRQHFGALLVDFMVRVRGGLIGPTL